MISEKAVEAAARAIDELLVGKCREYLHPAILTAMARAALEAALSLHDAPVECNKEASAWQPIETATKEAFAVEFGLWDADSKRWQWLTHGAWDPDRNCWSDWQPIEPTHWRPIGAPALIAEDGHKP